MTRGGQGKAGEGKGGLGMAEEERGGEKHHLSLTR